MGAIKDFFYKARRFARRVAYLGELEEERKKKEPIPENAQAGPGGSPLPGAGFKAISGLNLDDLIEYSIIDEDYRRQRTMSATDYFERLERDEIFGDELE